MNFLYYLPGENRPLLTAKDLPSPLKETLCGASIDCKKIGKGPDDGSGLLFVRNVTQDGATQPPTNIDREGQAWEPHGSFWLGWQRNELSVPADFRRDSKPVEGRETLLADGNEWLVPVVGPVFSRLPMVFRRKDGQSTLEIAERYRDLSQESMAFAAWMGSGEERAWTDIMEFCAKCLSLNYHVGLEEVSTLRLIDTQNARDVLSVIVGWTDLQEQAEAKKGQ